MKVERPVLINPFELKSSDLSEVSLRTGNLRHNVGILSIG